ncbi:MAG: PD40 domain-containing protein [Caldilineaceae bacterium]|nr:PD40 domain-containing protein [Caldilineaceae bacterium]
MTKHPRLYVYLFICFALLVGSATVSAQADSDGSLYVPLVTNGIETGPPGGTIPDPTPGATPNPGGDSDPDPTAVPEPGVLSHPVVFVSRQIPEEASAYWDEPRGMPGVGAFSRFQVASPGKLMVLEPSGTLRTLIDGENPTAASMNLIDVNAPDVSYDGQKIVFAGLPAGNYRRGPNENHNAWRIYVIHVDGTNLRQVTTSDLDFSKLDLSRFDGVFRNAGYDDTDPAWLPDGRIVFSSTRWPSFAQYSSVRTSNLDVVNEDGSGLHRITSERNGADRPLVDPITGQIVYARWWRNHRVATDKWETITSDRGGFLQANGLTTQPRDTVGRPAHLTRNSWQLATINPDGTGLKAWTGHYRDVDIAHAYGGSFADNGELIANYFPMGNMSEAAGFGGLRRYWRGPGLYEPLIGVTYLSQDYVSPNSPTSFGIFKGSYASEPDVLPDGRIVFSWAPDIYQDYGLYLMNADGSGRTLLYDNPGTTELRARLIRTRPVPPIIPDTVNKVPGPLPAPANGPYDQDGTFVFDALNVYFNAPVDVPIINAPAIGSAHILRFFMDQQRTSPGSFFNLDWPILLEELPVSPQGVVHNPDVPAYVPLFEQLRSADGTVPLTFGPDNGGGGGGPLHIPGAVGGPLHIDGAAHVAGMNFGNSGSTERCVGCHAGHSMIPVPENDADAQWTNLAPGAEVRVSSSNSEKENTGLIDRRVMNDSIRRYWTSAAGQTQNQWVELVFPVPVSVRTVRLYNPRQGDEANSTLLVNQATVRLYSDSAGTVEVAHATTGELAVSGTDVPFNDVQVRVVRVELDSVSGTFFGSRVASLAEIEVIARGVGQ